MKLRHVKIDDVKVPEVRVTAQFDPELWEQFKSSMKETGQVAPIIVYETEEGLVLCDGLHRLMEARQNGDSHIYAAVLPGDMVDVLTKNIFLDHLRGKTPVSQMVTVIGTLWKEYQLDSDKIREKTGLTRDYVEKLMVISQLTPFCLQMLDEGRIGVGHAFALTKVQDPVRQETILNQCLLYRWSVKDLEGYIKDVEALVAQREAQPAVTAERKPILLKCVYCGRDVELGEIRNPNTCQECSGIMFASIAEARRQVAEDQAVKKEPQGG